MNNWPGKMSKRDLRYALHKRISWIVAGTKLQVVPRDTTKDAEDLILWGFARRFNSSRALYHRDGASLLFGVDVVGEVSLARLKSANSRLKRGYSEWMWEIVREGNASGQEILRKSVRKLDCWNSCWRSYLCRGWWPGTSEEKTE